ncbi:L-fuculokinase, partial [Candidatus Bathyarchaeota archaeon]|nr:L-fuculokinase [Candidatus Bathyarchaeota archaeon]
MSCAGGSHVLVFDCGSTNLKAVAVDSAGNICAYAKQPNGPRPQPGGEPGWLIWDLDEIWLKLCELSREVSARVGAENIKAVTVITWGADGAPVKRDGSLTYPPISWQCPRTREIAQAITERISAWEIFRITGYQIIPFNTLFKLIWLRRNEPEALENAYTWLMMPGLIANRLTGEFHMDPTTASTMMAMDLGERDWSATMLELAELDASFFPEWREPGEIVGYVSREAGR